jgi:hypothetical protein
MPSGFFYSPYRETPGSAFQRTPRGGGGVGRWVGGSGISNGFGKSQMQTHGGSVDFFLLAHHDPRGQLTSHITPPNYLYLISNANATARGAYIHNRQPAAEPGASFLFLILLLSSQAPAPAPRIPRS